MSAIPVGFLERLAEEPPLESAPGELIEGLPCLFCAEDFYTEVYDYDIEERWILFHTCCERSYFQAVYEMQFWTQPQLREWLRQHTGLQVRALWTETPAEYDCFPAVLDYGLDIRSASLAEINAFLLKHHRHNGRVNTFKIGSSIWNGPTQVGVMTVEPPRARLLKHRRTALEVTRVCIDSRIEPHELVANACSMLYGHAAREAKRLGYRKVVTYTRQDERGTSPRAAGFVPAFLQKKAGVWNCPSRPRSLPHSEPVLKIRWERNLYPAEMGILPTLDPRDRCQLNEILDALAKPLASPRPVSSSARRALAELHRRVPWSEVCPFFLRTDCDVLQLRGGDKKARIEEWFRAFEAIVLAPRGYSLNGEVRCEFPNGEHGSIVAENGAIETLHDLQLC